MGPRSVSHRLVFLPRSTPGSPCTAAVTRDGGPHGGCRRLRREAEAGVLFPIPTPRETTFPRRFSVLLCVECLKPFGGVLSQHCDLTRCTPVLCTPWTVNPRRLHTHRMYTPLRAGAETSAELSPRFSKFVFFFPPKFASITRPPEWKMEQDGRRRRLAGPAGFLSRVFASLLCVIVTVFVSTLLHANFDCAIEIKLQYRRAALCVATRPQGSCWFADKFPRMWEVTFWGPVLRGVHTHHAPLLERGQ